MIWATLWCRAIDEPAEAAHKARSLLEDAICGWRKSAAMPSQFPSPHPRSQFLRTIRGIVQVDEAKNKPADAMPSTGTD